MTTPLGDIEICIDGKTIKYTAQNMGVMDRLCPDADGKFCIKVEFRLKAINQFYVFYIIQRFST